MNKLLITILLASISSNIFAQVAFHNAGNVQIHDQGQVGFHIDVINDGTFDNNLGLAGFYNTANSLTVSGTSRPVFHDLEVDVPNDLFLEVSVGTDNFQQFVNGRVITPRDQKNVSFDYLNDAPYDGENDDRFVDGYASVQGDLDFTFPIGDDYRLRPMSIDNQSAAIASKGAYFFENPNSPNYFSDNFNTESRAATLFNISIFEFWDLDGDVETGVTLTWDDNSNIPTLVDDLNDLRVVGWDIETEKWVNLGNVSTTGNMDSGSITSESIIPSKYAVLTFGSSSNLLDGDLEIFTAISPNGDNLNDSFRIIGLAEFPNNEVLIYNRWGVLVYSQKQYHLHQETNGFKGISDGRATINKDEKLPEGTYYYILKIDGSEDRSGYLYINR
ncbi:gliding motility-associated C-terminal domain-containing protein [Aquimarina hainanensis]|uniref:Gliding motility-associated C-terminal domain-containing protein n=1 Tax=Aquimarina hainanensis TaxID=1578017 RepID=A0ABW5N9I5_9FLAO